MKKILKKKFIKTLKLKGIAYALKISRLLFKKAQTTEELNLVYKTRYEIYKNEGYIKENKEKLFKDKYDPYSVNFIIFKNGKPLGTARLVFDSKIGFPTENLFNFKKPEINRKRTAEVSRLAIKKEFRGGDRLITMGLMKMIYDYTKKNNIEHLYVNMPERLREYFSRFGLHFQNLKEMSPTKANLKERELIGGYFSQKKLKPYILDVKEMKQLLGL